MTLTHLCGIVRLFTKEMDSQMNKFAKALLLNLVLTAPVALTAPEVQAATASKTTVTAAPQSIKANKATKSTKMYKKHHHRKSMHRASNVTK